MDGGCSTWLGVRCMTRCTLFVGLLSACGGGHDRMAELEVRASDSSGIKLLELSLSPNSVARAKNVTSARLVRSLDGSKLGVRNVADVAEMQGGRLAILDRADAQILIVDSAGLPLRRMVESDQTRPFSEALSIAALGESLVVLRSSEAYPLEMRDGKGALIRAGGWETGGRWKEVMSDGPKWRLGGAYESLGDPAHALRAIASGDVIVETEPSVPHDQRVTESFLIRVGPDLKVIDTLAVVRAAARVPAIGRGDREDRVLFAPAPVWDASEDWIIVADGLVPEARVFDVSGLRMVVRWPSDRPTVTARDRRNAAVWLSDLTARSDSTAMRAVQALSQSQLRDAQTRMERSLAFDSAAAEVSSILAIGNCALIGGWRSEAALDGSASSYIVLVVPAATVLGLVHVPAAYGRIRATGDLIHTAVIDSLGASYVESYSLPWTQCRPRQPRSNPSLGENDATRKSATNRVSARAVGSEPRARRQAVR